MTPAKKLIMMGIRKYKNLISNGNFAVDSDSDGLGDSWVGTTLGDEGNLSVDHQIIDNAQQFKSTGNFSGIQQQIIATTNYKYYVAGFIKIIIGDRAQIRTYGFAENGSDVITTIGEFVSASAVITKIAAGDPLIAIHNSSDGAGTIIQCKNILCVDLTSEFGLGNEPNIEWCDANIPQNIIW